MEGLPPDSAAHRAVLGHDWTRHWQWYLADVRDIMAQLLVLTANVNRKPGSAAESAPESVWRPETSAEAKQLAESERDDDFAETEAVTAELKATAERIFTPR